MVARCNKQVPELNTALKGALIKPAIWITLRSQVKYIVLEINTALTLQIDYRLPNNTEGSTLGIDFVVKCEI
jgi:hypothetical protein